jgi:hypothetical protein
MLPTLLFKINESPNKTSVRRKGKIVSREPRG